MLSIKRRRPKADTLPCGSGFFQPESLNFNHHIYGVLVFFWAQGASLLDEHVEEIFSQLELAVAQILILSRRFRRHINIISLA